MPGFWDGKAPDAASLRLFIPGEGWRGWSDHTDPEQPAASKAGSRSLIESAFINALESANLLLLAGSGSSFSATVDGLPVAPSMLKLWEAVQAGLPGGAFEQILALFPAPAAAQDIEKLLSLCKIYLELHEQEQSAEKTAVESFVMHAERRILSAVDFVGPQTNLDAHTTILRKLGKRGVRKPRSKIFTTNYDLCFEEAARRLRFIAIDGFSHTLVQTYDQSYFELDLVRREGSVDAPDYVDNVVHIYKLHGSADWRRSGGDILRSASTELGPVLIYPRSSKYQESFETPFIDLMAAYQRALREPDCAVIVSGFGFHDDHISRPLLAALEANLTLRLIVCDIGFLDDADLVLGDHSVPAPGNGNLAPPLASILRLATAGDSRVHLINGRFADMALAIPDVVGETDRERHINRVRVLRPAAAE